MLQYLKRNYFYSLLKIASVFHSMHKVNNLHLFVTTDIDTVREEKGFRKLSRSECSNFILAFSKIRKAVKRVESCQDMELNLCKFVSAVVCRISELGLSRNCLFFLFLCINYLVMQWMGRGNLVRVQIGWHKIGDMV